MPLFRTIRAKVAFPIVALVASVVGGVGFIGALRAGREAEERARAEIARAARVVVDGGFLFSPEVLRHAARFLGGEIAVLYPDGALAVATVAPPRREALARALEPMRARTGTADEPHIHETSLEGRPVTIALSRVAAPSGAVPARGILAVIRQGHLLSGARRNALRPALAAGGVGVAVAVGAALALARRLVRPVERLAEAARRIQVGEPGARLEAGTGDEVERLARALEDMVRGLRAAEARAHEAQRLATLGRLLAGLAHELKNPLAALRMTAELLRERLQDPREREAIELVLEETERLGLFAAKLLAYAKGPVVAPRPTALSELASSVERVLARQLAHLGVRLDVTGLVGAPFANADPIAFRHVLMNLVLNAADAMPGGGTIRISADPVGMDRICVQVEDEGSGVSAEDVPRLFEPFFTRKPGGTGLGLAMCRAIAEAHGGSIEYAPASSGHGSLFRVVVPRAPPAPAPAGTEAKEA